MKRIRRTCAALILSITFVLPALAGEIYGGVVSTPTPGDIHAGAAGDMGNGTAGHIDLGAAGDIPNAGGDVTSVSLLDADAALSLLRAILLLP